MYGNYPHFMKFPAGFSGKCFPVCTVRGDGEMGGGGPDNRGGVESPMFTCTYGVLPCARACVHAWVRETGRPLPARRGLHIRVSGPEEGGTGQSEERV